MTSLPNPNEPTNDIPQRQNSRSCLDLLAAASQLYGRAKTYAALQFIATVPLAIGLGAVAMAVPSMKAPAALFGLVISLVDLLFLTEVQRKLKRQAAGLQECFDCQIMDIPWNERKLGPELEYRETVPADAKSYIAKHGETKLRDWYSPSVGQLPLFVARLACQRASISWDDKLRGRYRTLIIAGASVLIVGLLVAGLLGGITLEDFVLTFLAPVFPTIQWATRECRQQTSSIAILKRLCSYTDTLLKEVAEVHQYERRFDDQARGLQDELFDHRSTNSMIPNWFYNLFRSEFDGRMDATIEALVRQWH